MEESGQKDWSQRVNWANCREPFKSDLDGLATLWIRGQLSNGDLAMELWEMWAKTKGVPQAKISSSELSSDQLVQKQIEILVEALREAADVEISTPEERRDFLDESRTLFRMGDEEIQR